MENSLSGIGAQIVELAKKEVGYVETPINKTKFGEWFGMDGREWCAMFVSWCYYFAGKPITHGGFSKGFAGTQTAVKAFKAQGWETKSPVPGDIVIFDFDKDGKQDHTGIFEKWIDADTFSAIEGNTSDKSKKNGGMVMRRTRNKSYSTFFHLP